MVSCSDDGSQLLVAGGQRLPPGDPGQEVSHQVLRIVPLKCLSHLLFGMFLFSSLVHVAIITTFYSTLITHAWMSAQVLSAGWLDSLVRN